jgi:transposase
MKDNALENSVVAVFTKGWAIRRIAREFNISRNRVKRILIRNKQLREDGEDQIPKPQKRASKLDPFKEYINEVLKEFTSPAPTCQRIFELIQEKGYDGGLTILKDYLATIRPKRKAEPIITIETEPGQRGQHDWSEYSIHFTQTVKAETVILFSFILSYSRRQYIEIVENKMQTTLFRALINAFDYFGGVPQEIKADNQKACVDRWEAGKVIFNNKYLQFATHYQFRPLTIRPGKPRENLKVERPFYYLETNFLNARSFFNRDDLKQQLSDWLLTKNDVRIHRTTRRQPIEMFDEEVRFLNPLPRKAFDTSTVVYRVVNNEACIEWDGYFYAVPKAYLSETCPVRITQNELLIYSPVGHPACGEFELLVVHKLAEKGRKDRYIGRSLIQRNRPATVDATEVINRLKTFGPTMEAFIKQIKKHKPNNYLYHLRSILALKNYYQPTDILIAVERAVKYRVFEARAIENFLAINAKKNNESQITAMNFNLKPNKSKSL